MAPGMKKPKGISPKKCTQCKAELPLAFFGRKGYDTKGLPRFRGICNTCRRAVRKTRKVVALNTEITQRVEESRRISEKLPYARRYLITWAQNATPVHKEFLRAARTYCRENAATLIVIPGRYKNPTSQWSTAAAGDDWWASELIPYLNRARQTISELVTVYGDISIQPTATRPLSGFQAFGKSFSAIFGHPRVHSQSIATAKRYYPRWFTTTGAITVPNYTQSKAGKKAEIHHRIGGIILEVQGRKNPKYFIRRVSFDPVTQGFIDLDKWYGDSVKAAVKPLALVCGDIHVAKSDPAVLDATFFAPSSIVKTLSPRKLVFHDTLDFAARNHHNIDSFSHNLARFKGNYPSDVREELQDVAEFLRTCASPSIERLVVSSNHDDALMKWLLNSDFRQDPQNAQIFIDLWQKILDPQNKGVKPLELAMRLFPPLTNVQYLQRDRDYRIGQWRIGFHGDNGLNGARPSQNTWAQLGVPVIVGHSHSPFELDSAIGVGVTGSLDQGYNSLPSSWLNSHCLVNADETATILHVIDGDWRR